MLRSFHDGCNQVYLLVLSEAVPGLVDVAALFAAHARRDQVLGLDVTRRVRGRGKLEAAELAQLPALYSDDALVYQLVQRWKKNSKDGVGSSPLLLLRQSSPRALSKLTYSTPT